MSKMEIGESFKTNEGYFCTVLEYRGCDDVLVRFNDQYRHERTVRTQQLRSGKIKNPYHPIVFGKGFYGDGPYKALCKTGNTLEYGMWVNMLARCYGNHKKLNKPTYIDCHVCEEWLNFQVFAKWLNANPYHNKGYALDKDVLIKGNKIYSPAACALLPRQINSAVIIRKPSLNGYPVGVTANKGKGMFDVRISKKGKIKSVGTFASISLARSAYIKEKELYVRELAMEFKDRIDHRVFSALMQWTV